jgi:hypothetical protein
MSKVTFVPKANVNSVEIAVQGYDKLVLVDESGLTIDPVKDPLIFAALDGHDKVKVSEKSDKGTAASAQPDKKEG